MAQKGISRKQFVVQIILGAIYIAVGAIFLISGISDTSILICGTIEVVLALIMIVGFSMQRKRHPIEDPDADRKATEGLKSAGILFAILAVGLLVAFGLAFILRK